MRDYNEPAVRKMAEALALAASNVNYPGLKSRAWTGGNA